MLVDIRGKGVVRGVFINLHFSKGGYRFTRKILGGVIIIVIIRAAEKVKSSPPPPLINTERSLIQKMSKI